MKNVQQDAVALPGVADRAAFQAALDALRIREKAHTRKGDAIAAARRRLPMVEVDARASLIGEHGALTLLDAFEGRRMLTGYYFIWHIGKPAPEQCEGCTWFTSQVRELTYVHSRDVTYATLCQGPYEASARYRDYALVFGPGRARHAAGRVPHRHDASGVLPAPGLQSVQDLLHMNARRRGHGQQRPPARSDRVWAAGGMGGFAARLAARMGRGTAARAKQRRPVAQWDCLKAGYTVRTLALAAAEVQSAVIGRTIEEMSAT